MWKCRCKVPWLCSDDFLGGLRLWRAACGLCECAHDTAAREIDLEGVVCVSFGVAQQHIRRASERRGISRLPTQSSFGLRIAPRLVGDTPERETPLLDDTAIELEPNRNRNDGERVREPVPNFQVREVRGEAFRRKFHRNNDLAGIEIGVALRCIAWQPMKIRKCDHAVAGRATHMDFRFQHRERHAHVGRVRRDAGVTAAEDRMYAIMAVDGGAAAGRLAFVAGRRCVVEVRAAGALQEIATRRCHITKLLRGSGHDRAGENRIANGNAGGNAESVIPATGETIALHAYWDRIFGGYSSPYGAVFDADDNGIADIAVNKIAAEISDPETWIKESAELAKQFAYAPPVSTGTNAMLLTREYETNARNI